MYVKQKVFFSILPIFISIGVYVYISSQIFIWIGTDLSLVNTYNASIALGSILMGFLSDMYCRRKILVMLHFAAPLLLTACYLNSASYMFIFLTGLIYNPLSIVRANLIDNTTEYSKIKLISFSFMIQFFPETLYFLFKDIPKDLSYLSSLGLILLSLLLGLIFFFDRRDERIKHENLFSKLAFFIPNTGARAMFTFLAFIPTQIAYFITDNLLETYSLNPLYYSILAFGSFIGAGLASIYKKTPHVSVLTIAYGVALLLSVLPIGAEYIYDYHELNIPYMFIALGSLLGFYISFVYDVILHSVEKNFRGSACGILDFVYAGASLVTLVLYKDFAANIPFTLILVAIAFAIALTLQRAAEQRHS